MKIVERLKGTANTKKRNMAIAAGAVLFIGCVGGFLYLSGKGGDLFRPAAGGSQQNNTTPTGIKRPESNPDIMGIVESVSGNEVKILKLDSSSMPGMNRNNNSGNGRSRNSSGTGSGTGSERPQGNWQGEQGRTGSGSGSAARTAMLAELKKKSTGEETVIVPVGIQMIKMGGGQKNISNNQNNSNDSNNSDNSNNQGGANRPPMGEETEATISDLAADKMVMIWLNSKVTDRKVAEFVSIMR